MTTHRIKLTADETDAFSRWRGMQHWSKGQLKRIKNGYNRRLRRKTKLAAMREVEARR